MSCLVTVSEKARHFTVCVGYMSVGQVVCYTQPLAPGEKFIYDEDECLFFAEAYGDPKENKEFKTLKDAAQWVITSYGFEGKVDKIEKRKA